MATEASDQSGDSNRVDATTAEYIGRGRIRDKCFGGGKSGPDP